MSRCAGKKKHVRTFIQTFQKLETGTEKKSAEGACDKKKIRETHINVQ